MNQISFSQIATRTVNRRLFIAELNVPGKVNKLTGTLWDELSSLVTHCGENPEIAALILTSAKPAVFLAGADLEEFVGVSHAHLQHMLSRAHRVFHQIEALRKPVVAAVSGAALGGGLELLMAVHGVVAVDDDRIAMGLPETGLGLIPGAGGTQRLPTIAGVEAAVDLICGGRPVTPGAAKELGVVDRLCGRDELLAEAGALAERLIVTGHRPKRLRKPVVGEHGLDATELRGRLQAREAVTSAPTPARLAACEAVARGASLHFHEGLALESSLFSRLLLSAETQQAIGRFLNRAQPA